MRSSKRWQGSYTAQNCAVLCQWVQQDMGWGSCGVPDTVLVLKIFNYCFRIPRWKQVRSRKAKLHHKSWWKWETPLKLLKGHPLLGIMRGLVQELRIWQGELLRCWITGTDSKGVASDVLGRGSADEHVCEHQWVGVREGWGSWKPDAVTQGRWCEG